MHYVIGSGPAGISAAYALIKQGEEVTMLDAGVTPEPEIEQALVKLGRAERKRWDKRLLAKIRGASRAKGSIRKLSYGSDYPYRGDHVPMIATDVDCSPSFARGGLSTVWGAAVLPYQQADIKDWPISVKQLTPHYKAVLEFMPLAGDRDDIDRLFPFRPALQELRHSRQAAELLAALKERKDSLKAQGITFGSSRLAVDPEQGKGCVYCGLCMHGCPYQLIYSTSMTLNRLMREPGFRYIGGIIVERLEEKGDRVTIHARSGKRKVSYDAQRVFLGAGPVPTAAIMLRSTGQRRAVIRDSQYFLLPLLRLRATPEVAKEDLHTLAQAFIEVQNRDVSRHTVHMQIYTYNDLYDLELRKRFGPLYPLIPTGWLVKRMVLIQGFLHSAESSSVAVEDRDGKLVMEKRQSARTKPVIRALMRLISRNAMKLGMVPLLPALNIEKPGRSFHFGGSFPMRRRPRAGETDTYGRPHGWKRVHIIDASVFPSIAATTITYTIMANAHRIASEYRRAK